MKLLHLMTSITAIVAGLSFTSCLENNDDTFILEKGTVIPEGYDETRIVSSNESTTFNRAGFTLTVPLGAVPSTSSGANGSIAFSITRADELPSPLPSNATIVNDASIKIEPMNFVFNTPLNLIVPSQGQNPSNISLLHYNETTSQWESIPFSAINSDGTMSVSVIELGYFVLVKYDTVISHGGIHISQRYLSPEYYYYITLIPRNNSNNNSHRIGFAPNGSDLYLTNIPLGQYIAIITRELRNGLSSESTRIESLDEFSVNVSTRLTVGNGNFSTYSGWTEITLSQESWHSGRPSAWGTATTTYGTGKFQATLTWVNNTNDATDYDLHLIGPSSLHVYYRNKQEGAFELDRDWLTGSGNAVENIYSINDNIESGSYQVRVLLYSGTKNKRYNCRVIVNGTVIKSVTGSISTEKGFDDICSFDI